MGVHNPTISRWWAGVACCRWVFYFWLFKCRIRNMQPCLKMVCFRASLAPWFFSSKGLMYTQKNLKTSRTSDKGNKGAEERASANGCEMLLFVCFREMATQPYRCRILCIRQLLESGSPTASGPSFSLHPKGPSSFIVALHSRILGGNCYFRAGWRSGGVWICSCSQQGLRALLRYIRYFCLICK